MAAKKAAKKSGRKATAKRGARKSTAKKGARKASTRKRASKSSAKKGARKATAKKGGRKYGKKASKKVGRVMKEFKEGKLKSGSGDKVTSRKQAIAIGISEARSEGDKVPKKRSARKASS